MQGVAVSQIVLVFDDLENFEECPSIGICLIFFLSMTLGLFV